MTIGHMSPVSLVRDSTDNECMTRPVTSHTVTYPVKHC